MSISKKIEGFMTRASWIRRMFEEGQRLRQQHGPDSVCDFTLGNPLLEPPAAVQEALSRAVNHPEPGMHRYMPNAGYPECRRRVAEYIAVECGLPVRSEDVLMTTGAGAGLNVALRALCDPGDEVAVIAPFFPEYAFYLDNHGLAMKTVPAAPDFDLDLEALRAALGPRTRAVIINSPNNPTGRMYSAERLRQLGELLSDAEKRHGAPITILSDEPYRKLVFDGLRTPDIFAAHDNVVLINSHSKDLGLAGERIGWAVVSPRHRDREALREAMVFTNRTLGFVNAPALFQRVVSQSLDASVDIAAYQALRDRMCAVLERAGLEFVKPQGAFYVFPRTPIPDDLAFVQMLVRQRVLAVPGSGFGRAGHMRVCFSVPAGEIDRSEEGFRRAVEEAARAG
jgi:aspartate aminotransferase